MKSIVDALSGVRADEMQTVGAISIVPLLSDLQDLDFVAPDSNVILGSPEYGTLVFKNKSEKTLLIPAHTAYMTKQATQDHAMTVAGVAAKKSSVTFKNARCIQQTQGGHIRGEDFKMQLLPFPLREFAYGDRNHVGYNRLWEKIQEFGASVGANTQGGHLRYFYDQYSKQLEEFVAEFEYIDKQVGAIILVNGYVIAIERTPSHDYFKSIWKALIRDCYGAISIQLAKSKPVNRFPLSDDVHSIQDIRKSLENAKKSEREHARSVVNQIISREFHQVDEDKVDDNISIIYAENDQLVGQYIVRDSKTVYVSFVIKEGWKKNRKWNEATPFKM